ncbi:hypothetical protein ABPG75_004741 [Micractinium tetrahymenae]
MPAEGDAKLAGPAVGGAAILARLRAQRAAAASGAGSGSEAAPSAPDGPATGTAQEIAKNIQAEAEAKGLRSRVASMNEFGFDNLNAKEAPLLVYVASSTGDGDAPDNAAKFYATLRRKSQPAGLLAGIGFTGFGLGDSNYTRFMYVPRAVRQRLLDLGAEQFYDCGEADEVDGIEIGLDKWLEGLWPALKKAAAPEGAAEAVAAAAAAPAAEGSGSGGAASADGEFQGVPPLPRCRVRLAWQEDAGAAAAVRAAEASAPSAADLAQRDPAGEYSAEAPFWAPVIGARYLTTELSGPDRQVLHLELDISGSSMRYSPGDSLGVLPENDPALVQALLERLGLDGDAVFDVAPAEEEGEEQDGGAGGGGAQAAAPAAHHHTERLLPHLRAPCSARRALARGVDLTGPPRKSLLRLLAEHCAAPEERAALLCLCSREGREAYASEVLAARPSLLHLLRRFPSCRPPLAALLDALPPLAARMYSLSCSPLECPGKAQFAFTVVRYRTEQHGEQQGVATSWLHRLCDPIARGATSAAAAGVRLPVFLRRGGGFGPPQSLEIPLLMIGPGTGVTPFRGFLQHRRAQLAAAGSGGAASRGTTWLFFGCRRQDQDYLYQEDLEGFVADGALDHLHVAFSRAQGHKVYVQHLMKRHAGELYKLIDRQGARVYVCGDGAAMAKDVHACLAGILQSEGGLTEAEATERLHEMTRQGRYVRDIWS